MDYIRVQGINADNEKSLPPNPRRSQSFCNENVRLSYNIYICMYTLGMCAKGEKIGRANVKLYETRPFVKHL